MSDTISFEAPRLTVTEAVLVTEALAAYRMLPLIRKARDSALARKFARATC